jgi:hypothetical protein
MKYQTWISSNGDMITSDGITTQYFCMNLKGVEFA